MKNVLKKSGILLGVVILGIMLSYAFGSSGTKEKQKTTQTQIALNAHRQSLDSKCGTGKCGAKDAKANKDDKAAKMDSKKSAKGKAKCGDGKCGDGKCGGNKTKDSKMPPKAGKQTKEKSKEAKCGTGKCGSY